MKVFWKGGEVNWFQRVRLQHELCLRKSLDCEPHTVARSDACAIYQRWNLDPVMAWGKNAEFTESETVRRWAEMMKCYTDVFFKPSSNEPKARDPVRSHNNTPFSIFDIAKINKWMTLISCKLSSLFYFIAAWAAYVKCCHRNMTVIRPIPSKSDACRMQILIKKWGKKYQIQSNNKY